MNNKGFTLVEILAVITILAVLSIIAIPAVSKAITSSRTDMFIQNAKEEINVAKSNLTAGNYAVEKHYKSSEYPTTCKIPPIGYFTIIPNDIIGTNTKSTFGYKFKVSNVVAVNVSNNNLGTGQIDKIVYYYGAVDIANNGILYKPEGDIKKKDVKIGNIYDTSVTLSTSASSETIFTYLGKNHSYKFYQKCKKK